MSKASMIKHWRFKQAAVGIICAICDEPISKGGDKGKGALTADHIVPKSLGGTWENANLQPAHAACNRNRQNYLLHEFKGYMKGQDRVKRAIEIIDQYHAAEVSNLTGLQTNTKPQSKLVQPDLLTREGESDV